jgi:hypothetical protein
MFRQFEELLNRKNQRFICIDTGWPEPGPERHTARIEHDVGPAIDEATLAAVSAQVGDLPELIEFYRRFGSARLYRDTIACGPIGYDSAFYIAPPDTWPELREYFEGWLEGLDEDEKDELLPDWIGDYVVIGEVPSSGNYFLVPLAGPDRGKVFGFDHDGFEFVERGKNLADFLNTISTVTDGLLSEILSHTRYYDGKTDTQWLCQSYLYDSEA